MKNILLLLICFTILVFFNSCDEIDKPYERNVEITTTTKKILVEEFTGYKCTNCPSAHDELARLQDLFGDNLIVTTIHVTEQAAPGNPPYDIEYRTPEGNDIQLNFGINAIPIAMINRSKSGDQQLFLVNDWQSKIIELFNDTLVVEIDMEHTYNETTRMLNLDITAIFLEDIEGTFKYAAFLMEDSLISGQYFPNAEDNEEFYVHRHVFRGVLNNHWTGDVLTDNAVANEPLTKSFNYVVSEDYVAKHCEVIAYVYNEATGEILEVEKIKILE